MNDAEKLLADSQFLRALKDPVINALSKQLIEAHEKKDFETHDKLVKLLSFYNQMNYPELIKSLPL